MTTDGGSSTTSPISYRQLAVVGVLGSAIFALSFQGADRFTLVGVDAFQPHQCPSSHATRSSRRGTSPTSLAFLPSRTSSRGVIATSTNKKKKERCLHSSMSSSVALDESPSSSSVVGAGSSAAASAFDDGDTPTVLVEQTPEEKRFLTRTAELCKVRNIPFDKIKNARDLATVAHSPIQPNRVYRMGKLSDSTDSDIAQLFDDMDIRTIIDLRSPTELNEDELLHRNEVFGDSVTVQWKEGKRTKYFRGSGHYSTFHGKVKECGMNAKISTVKSGDASDEGYDEEEEDDGMCPGVPPQLCPNNANRRERHFVSLMNEFKYVRGTLAKLRKRDIAKVLLKSPGAIMSRRVRKNVKDVFLNVINDGGLAMLNELMLRMGAPGIKYCLDLCADKNRHPVVFHCTAGKDRTGILAALILSVMGVPDEDIVEDYSMSANVYAEINDHTAMVGALSQRNLDAKTFLGAPPQVMVEVLESIREDYGSVEGYLDWIGFDADCRDKLKKALVE